MATRQVTVWIREPLKKEIHSIAVAQSRWDAEIIDVMLNEGVERYGSRTFHRVVGMNASAIGGRRDSYVTWIEPGLLERIQEIANVECRHRSEIIAVMLGDGVRRYDRTVFRKLILRVKAANALRREAEKNCRKKCSAVVGTLGASAELSHG